MADSAKFSEEIQTGYSFKSESYKIGRAMLDGQVVPGADVSIPFKTLNRHGLIAGAILVPAKPKPCRYWPKDSVMPVFR